MKRYRILSYDFDTRASILKQEVQDTWEPDVKRLWQNNKIQIKEGLIAQFGAFGCHQKIENFIELGASPFSIIAFHNKFLRQAREAFVIGAYYPALTAACSLGERILNQLILHLRDDYKDTNEYKKVYRKNSFDNWDLAIDTLESWQVLLPDVAILFNKLKETRNQSIHFNPETDKNDRELALKAIHKLTEIIVGQFAGFGPLPWIIPKTKGAVFIKKSYENVPFVNKIILPNCHLVGHLHTLEVKNDRWIVQDDHEYEDKEITDEEFTELFNNR